MKSSSRKPSPWTPYRTRRLKELWHQGLSITKIGEKMKVSRNSIAGKADRLGLKRKKPADKNKKQAKKAKPPYKIIPIEEEKNVPLKLALRRINWSRKTCSWPIGDPQSTDFSFCGAPVVQGKPYCNTHCFDAYTTTREGTN